MDVGKNDWRSSVFFHPTSRANIGDAVSILHSSEEERLEITSNITGSWQGKLRNQYLKCFKVLNRKKSIFVTYYFFYKKIFENFTHIHAHKKYLGHICSWLLTPRVLLEIHFPSKFMSSIFYNPLNPISTSHMHMDVVSPTEAYAILQWTMSPNKNDSSHPLADTSCE